MCVLEVGGKEGLPLNYVGFDDSGKKMVTINSDVVCRVYCLEDEEVKMVEQICVGDERKGCGFVEFFWYNGLSFMKFGEKDFYEVVRSENGCELIPTKELKPMEGNVLEQSECKIGEVIYSFKRTPDNELIYNNKTTARDVTSFLMHNRYLLFTTSKSKLFCVHLIPQQLQKLAQSRQPEDDFFTRPIEPGSTIITTIPKTSDIILQTPRGNLEIISVRAISIYILENYLSQSEWRKALTYVRSERLNANLLIDLNPLRFINEVDKFVEACETPSVLNQICLELDDGNILVDLYRKCWIGEVVVLEGKRRKVCEAILGYLMAVDYANYIGTVVVIYVRHFGVEDALVCVQDLLERAKEDEGMLRVADEAVRTLLVYAKGTCS